MLNFRNIIGVNQLPGFNILYIPVPQVGHLPFIAGLPFFIVTFWASFISFLALHFTQYASKILTSSNESAANLGGREFAHTSIDPSIFFLSSCDLFYNMHWFLFYTKRLEYVKKFPFIFSKNSNDFNRLPR